MVGAKTWRRLAISSPLVCAVQVADGLESAVNRVLDVGFRTGDIMQEGCTKVGCSEMGTKLAAEVAAWQPAATQPSEAATTA